MANKIYKNLYFDEEQGIYYFHDGKNYHQVVDESSYLLIYLIEIILGGKNEVPFLSNKGL